MSREITNRVIALMDEGVLLPEQIALMCLGFMSEDDVKEMVQSNDLGELVSGGEYFGE